MKRRLLPALLALIMVLSLLPVTALAAVNYADVVRAPLEDHPSTGDALETLYDGTPNWNTTDKTVAGSALKRYEVTLGYTNLRQHHDAGHNLAYWSGISIPSTVGALYDWNWGTYDEAVELGTLSLDEDAGDATYDRGNVSYESMYFPLEANSNKTGKAYVAVSTDGSGTVDVVYDIDFTGTTFAVPFDTTADGWALGSTTPGAKWKAELGDWRSTTVSGKGTPVDEEELNVAGYKVCAEAAATANTYNVKVEHPGLRVHANGAGALGWWVGVTFPVAPGTVVNEAGELTWGSYKITSFKKESTSYTTEQITPDIAAHGGPTLYFDVSEGTSRTVTIEYQLNKTDNYFAKQDGKKVTVTYNIDLTGVKMLDGAVAGAVTTIDVGTILKQNPSSTSTVKNSIGAVSGAGAAKLPSATGDDNVLAAIGDAAYELEVKEVGKIALDNAAVAAIRTAAGANGAAIGIANEGANDEEDSFGTVANGTRYSFLIGTTGDSGVTFWNVVPGDYEYIMNVSADFGNIDITDAAYDAYSKLPSADKQITYTDGTPTKTGKADVSFYVGRGVSKNNVSVTACVPLKIVVTNTNENVAADKKTKTFHEDHYYLPISSDKLSSQNDGYVTVKDVLCIGDYIVHVTSNSGGGGGGATGGGTSGGTAPGTTTPGTTAPAQTVVKETVSSTTTGTAASANVTSATMDKAVNSAVSQATKAGNTPVVQIDVSVGASAESLEVTLPTSSLGKLANAAGSELIISSTIATVELDHTALAALVSAAGDNSTVTLEVSPVDTETLTEEQAAAILAIDEMLSQTEVDADIVDISLTVDGNAIHNYNNGNISVTVPFALPSGAVPSDVRVYYLDDDGSLTRCTASYADGKVTFVTSHLSKYIISAKALLPEVDFSDVSQGEYYFDAVAWAVANNVTTGTTATTFSPNDGCTRAQIVTFLWRAYGEPEAAADVNFTDIDVNEYYYNAVKWAVANGITTGTGDGTTFSPNQVCTRAEAVTFQKRAAGMNTMEGTASDTFTDVEPGAFYDNAVLWAVANGITTGTTATTFSPYDYCTRAQIVTFLFRQLG